MVLTPRGRIVDIRNIEMFDNRGVITLGTASAVFGGTNSYYLP